MDRSRSNREVGTGQKLRAVILGEPMLPQAPEPHGYPLSPVSPSDQLPFAMLPICNTPLIDYILENLVENDVNEVTIMLNRQSYATVKKHLSEQRTARGKPWLQSDAIQVSVVEGSRDMSKLADAVKEMRERNLVPQSGSFLFVPIDCIAFFHNLRECYQKHLERVKTIGKYAATLLCTSAKGQLDATLHNVLLRQVMDRFESQRADTGSPLSNRGGSHTDNMPILADYHRVSPVHVPATAKGDHTMFVLEKATEVVEYMSRLEPLDEDTAPEPPVLTFKGQRSVRMDLVPTGFLFCACEALALIEFHVRDFYTFLNASILGQAEIFQNVFGVLEVSQSTAIVLPVSSLETYIQANLDVCSRRLYPLTRESSFAEAQARYAVSSFCETVYLHTSAKAYGRIGPNVVVGERVVVPASVKLQGTVCGSNVTLGEGSTLVGCVLLDGARVGANCTIRGSVIGAKATVSDGADLQGCIVGPECTIGTMPSGEGVSLQHVSVVCQSMTGDREASSGRRRSSGSLCSNTGDGAVTDHWLVGSNGVGETIANRYTSSLMPTAALYTEDPTAKVDDVDEEEDGGREADDHGDEFAAFRQAIASLVEAGLQYPSKIESSAFDMKTVCINRGFGYPELCEVVTELLMEHILLKYGSSGAPAALAGAQTIFGLWCLPFYDQFLSKNGEMNTDAMMSTLEGLCAAIRQPSNILHCHAPRLLEILYNDCDDDLYDERGYDIVSGEGLIAFDAEMARRRQSLRQYTGYRGQYCGAANSSDGSDSADSSDADNNSEASRDTREEGTVTTAAACHAFITGVKQFLEGA